MNFTVGFAHDRPIVPHDLDSATSTPLNCVARPRLAREAHGDPVCRQPGSFEHDNDKVTLTRLANFDMESSLHHTFENFKYHAKDLLSVISGCLCQQQTKLKINGRLCAYSLDHFVWLNLR